MNQPTGGQEFQRVNGITNTGNLFGVNASYCKAQLGSTAYIADRPVIAAMWSNAGHHQICRGGSNPNVTPQLGSCRLFQTLNWETNRFETCSDPEIWVLAENFEGSGSGPHPDYSAWAGCQGICPPSAPPPDPPSPPPSPPSLPCQPVVLTFFNPSGEWEGLEVAFDGVEPNASDYVAGSKEMTYSVCRIPGCYELTIGGVVPDQINWYAFVFDEIVRSLPRYHSAPAS